MRKVYQGETVLACDTVTVAYGDTAVLTEGARFVWDTRLGKRNKVLIVKGAIVGLGENAFSGAPEGNQGPRPWDGIVIDSCASAHFASLAIHAATFGLEIRSKDVHIAWAILIGTGGILLPDSSVFRKDYGKDTLMEFRSNDLPSVARVKYKCPDPSKQSDPNEERSDFWNWSAYVVGAFAALVAIEVWAIGVYKGSW